MPASSPSEPTSPPASLTEQSRTPFWVWCVCGLLLLASSINYMDRQTLSNVSVRITDEFGLSNQQYGALEKYFGWAFAVGALFFGWMADRTNIRWLYPAVLIAWSAMGFLTGWATTFTHLLLCRTLLGFFEAGHWPCALRTTQRLLPSSKRTLGNSVLQSGTAIGAICTPLILRAMLTDAPGSWRPAFQIIGLVGVVWVALWLVSIRGNDLAPVPVPANSSTAGDFFAAIFHRRFITLVFVVILINVCYHFYRVWVPRFMQNERGYSEAAMLDFMFWFYIASDVGCIGAGIATAWLNRRGWSVHIGRLTVFAICGLFTSASLVVPFLPAGPAFIAVMMLISMGSLGMFPCYYAFSQELSVRHQGKVTGLLGTFAWLAVAPLHELFGYWIDQTGRADWGLAIAGLLPLLGAAAILIGWGHDKRSEVVAH